MMFSGLSPVSAEVGELLHKEQVEQFHWDTNPVGPQAMSPLYSFNASGFAVASGAAKTCALLRATTNVALVTEIAVSCDATAGNLIVDLVLLDGTIAGASASNPNPVQTKGVTNPTATTVGARYTVEPGVKTVFKTYRFPLPGGPFVIQYPLGRELQHLLVATGSGVGKQFAVQVTGQGYSGNANIDVAIDYEE